MVFSAVDRAHIYISNRDFEIVHMSFEESETEESASSLSEVSSLDDDFDRIDLMSGISDEEVTDDQGDNSGLQNFKDFMRLHKGDFKFFERLQKTSKTSKTKITFKGLEKTSKDSKGLHQTSTDFSDFNRLNRFQKTSITFKEFQDFARLHATS